MRLFLLGKCSGWSAWIIYSTFKKPSTCFPKRSYHLLLCCLWQYRKVPAVLYGKFSLIRETNMRMKIFHVPSARNSLSSRTNWASWVTGSGTDRNVTLGQLVEGFGIWSVCCRRWKVLRRTLHSLVPVSGHPMVSHLYAVLSLTPFPSLECIHLLSWYHLWPRPNWLTTWSSSSSLALSLTISLHFTHGPGAPSHYVSPVFTWGLWWKTVGPVHATCPPVPFTIYLGPLLFQSYFYAKSKLKEHFKSTKA